MKVIPIALYLKDRADAPSAPDAVSIIPLPAPEPVDHTAEIEEAFARGKQEGEAKARGAFESELQTFVARHRAELAEQRARWTAEQGSELAARLREMIGEMERRLADVLAQLLEPVLVENAKRLAVAEFCAAARNLQEQSRGVIHISGPADLLEAVKANLGEDIGAKFSAGDSCEARIEADDAVIETQLAPWIKRLGEAMT